MKNEELKMTFTQKITRDEMKNRISMALKDPISQQGFEIICKENAELKRRLDNLFNSDCWASEKLTKATELLKEAQGYIENIDDEGDELYDKIEQFLKDKNIILEDAQAGNSPFDADEVFNKEMKAYPEKK